MQRQTEEEQIELLYTIFQQKLTSLESFGFTPDAITKTAGLTYFDRKTRRMDADFKIPPAHEWQAIFDDLDQDPQTHTLLTWLAKNLNRFTRLILDHETTRENLRSLMTAKGLGLRDRNPSVLRAVINLVLHEYTARQYDPALLNEILCKFHHPRTDE